MTRPGPDTPEFHDSDREWFAALTGDATPRDPTSRPSRDGHALRAALAQRQKEADGDPNLEPEASDASNERQLDRLLQRADAEGAFDRSAPEVSGAAGEAAPSPPSNVVEFPWWRRRSAVIGLAASLLVAVGLVSQIERTIYPEPPQTHGADGIQRVGAPRPREAAERLAGQLRDAGLKPGLYQRGKTFVVDVNLMSAERATAARAFGTFGIEPAVGFNRVEVSPD
jgi:hypothetical protein